MSAIMGGGEGSFSIISSRLDEGSAYTPSASVVGSTEGQHTDDFEIYFDQDDEYVDEENRLHDLGSDRSTSLAPSVHIHETTYGRQYHGYKPGRYPLPNDQFEQHLEELKHHLLMNLTEGHLFLSDVREHPRKVIDIGTGGGTWAIDVADKYPDASVMGTDLSPVQSSWLPLNLQMFVDDCEEDDWLHGTGFDLAHMRDVLGFLRDQDNVLAKVHKNLRNGGWIELQDFIPQIHCDDGSMKKDDPLLKFMGLVADGMHRLGCSHFGVYEAKESLEKAGFVNVHATTKKVPIGPWARDAGLREIGLLTKTLLSGCLGALAAKPLAILDLTSDQRRKLTEQATASLEDMKIRRYVTFSVCYGQKKGLEVATV